MTRRSRAEITKKLPTPTHLDQTLDQIGSRFQQLFANSNLELTLRADLNFEGVTARSVPRRHQLSARQNLLVGCYRPGGGKPAATTTLYL